MLILSLLIVVLGFVLIILRYIEKQRDDYNIILASNEEVVLFLTKKVIQLKNENYSCVDERLMELSEELLYINSGNRKRINEIANEIDSIERLITKRA